MTKTCLFCLNKLLLPVIALNSVPNLTLVVDWLDALAKFLFCKPNIETNAKKVTYR